MHTEAESENQPIQTISETCNIIPLDSDTASTNTVKPPTYTEAINRLLQENDLLPTYTYLFTDKYGYLSKLANAFKALQDISMDFRVLRTSSRIAS